MTWILLIIQLIPTIIKIIQAIRELIAGLPQGERAPARAELRQLARKHVKRYRKGDAKEAQQLARMYVQYREDQFQLAAGHGEAVADFQAMKDRLTERVRRLG